MEASLSTRSDQRLAVEPVVRAGSASHITLYTERVAQRTGPAELTESCLHLYR
jgi:hypothetical protein